MANEVCHLGQGYVLHETVGAPFVILEFQRVLKSASMWPNELLAVFYRNVHLDEDHWD